MANKKPRGPRKANAQKPRRRPVRSTAPALDRLPDVAAVPRLPLDPPRQAPPGTLRVRSAEDEARAEVLLAQPFVQRLVEAEQANVGRESVDLGGIDPVVADLDPPVTGEERQMLGQRLAETVAPRLQLAAVRKALSSLGPMPPAEREPADIADDALLLYVGRLVHDWRFGSLGGQLDDDGVPVDDGVPRDGHGFSVEEQATLRRSLTMHRLLHELASQGRVDVAELQAQVSAPEVVAREARLLVACGLAGAEGVASGGPAALTVDPRLAPLLLETVDDIGVGLEEDLDVDLADLLPYGLRT